MSIFKDFARLVIAMLVYITLRILFNLQSGISGSAVYVESKEWVSHIVETEVCERTKTG